MAPAHGEILYLYENDLSIVIGRYQNPWRECRTGLARRLGVPVIRRISGGGTVVHSPGNLNFSFIAPHPLTRSENLDLVIRALDSIGIGIQRSDRHDLLVRVPGDGSDRVCKVSGSAFRQTARASLHHGTLLVNSDLGTVREFLRVPNRDIEGGGVASRPSPVANLSEIASGVDVSLIAEVLMRERDGADPTVRISLDEVRRNPAYAAALDRYRSDAWTWGNTPRFTETFFGLPIPGNHMRVQVEGGRFTSIDIGTARIPSAEQLCLEKLIGREYSGESVEQAFGTDPPPWTAELACRVDGDGISEPI